MKRIMVDMSATLIHHGHIRLIKKAAEMGEVVIGLTTDEDILLKKGYKPELNFDQRKEILESLNLVNEVVPTPWMIDNSILDKHNIDKLVHGDDNSNKVSKERLIIFPRTKRISSTELRKKSLESLMQARNEKLMLTPGPAAILPDSLSSIKPVFGRGDIEFEAVYEETKEWILGLSGQDELMIAQGSSTFSIELAAKNFIQGKVLLISTGYYSDRIINFLDKNCDLDLVPYEDFFNYRGKCDWVICAYTETSTAFKTDIEKIKSKSEDLGAKLFVDATGSIGLEANHNLADVVAFSSCKGLLGITGASFIGYKKQLNLKDSSSFYSNMYTHLEKKVTGPYHVICSLYGIKNNHGTYLDRIIKSKEFVMKKYRNFINRSDNQPLLCTYLNAKIEPKDEGVVLYQPRSKLKGSVICHFGEVHKDTINLENRISVLPIK